MSMPYDVEGEWNRLSRISTKRTLLRQAHDPGDAKAEEARADLLDRYRSAIRSYFHTRLKDSSDAEDLTQDLMLRMWQGKLGGAVAGVVKAKGGTVRPGRFRDYLKRVMKNDIRRLYRERRRMNQWFDELTPEVEGDDDWSLESEADATYRNTCRRIVIDMALEDLDHYQSRRPGNFAATLMRLVIEHPRDDGETRRLRLLEAIGKTKDELNSVAFRQQLARARKKFGEFLVKAVSHTLDNPSSQCVEQELIDLELMPYLGDCLKKAFDDRSEED